MRGANYVQIILRVISAAIPKTNFISIQCNQLLLSCYYPSYHTTHTLIITFHVVIIIKKVFQLLILSLIFIFKLKKNLTII